LTEEILGVREIEAYVRSWRLLPSTGGVFEVTVNDEKVFSKKELGRHAEPGEVKALIEQKLNELKPKQA
jgi:selenoprotein W-related protein